MSAKLILGVISLILSIAALVGLGYLTRFVFQAKKGPNGQMCVKMSKDELRMAQLTVTLLWASVLFTIIASAYASGTMVCPEQVALVQQPVSAFMGKKASKQVALGFTFVVTIIELVALGFLSKFAYAAKQANGHMCVKMSEGELNFSKAGVVILWVGVASSLLASGWSFFK